MGAILPSPSLSTQLSDALENQVMKGRAQHQPVLATLFLQEQTTLLHSNPVATDLLLSSISKTTKNLKSSSNRGRNADDLPEHTSICSVPVVQMGDILGANSTIPEQDGSKCIDQQRGRWLVIEYLTGILASIDPAEMQSSVKTVDW
jgi:hypothetical protein